MASYLVKRKDVDKSFQHVDCVRWAPDGRIAVMTMEHVLILQYPPDPSNPADFTCHQAVPSQRSPASTGAMHPRHSFAPGVYPHFLEKTSAACDHSMCLVQLSWSPVGCAWDGGCLMALLTSYGLLEVLSAPVHGLDYDWTPTVCLSDMLLNYLRSVDFDIARPVAVARQSASRRGGADSHAAALDPSVWLARRNLMSLQCVAWAPRIFSLFPPTTLLAMGSRGMLCIVAFSARARGRPGSFQLADKDPAVIIPARDLSCLAWHVGGASEHAMNGGGGGGGSSGGPGGPVPEAILATGSSDGAVQTFRVRWAGGSPAQWELIPLRELSRACMRRAHSLCLRGDLPYMGGEVMLVAAMGQSLQVWAVGSGRRVQMELEAHEDTIVSVDWLRTTEGEGPMLVTGSLEGCFKVWSVKQDVYGGGAKFYPDPTITLAQPRVKSGTQLLGLAMSPNHQLLVSVRSVGEDTTNSREVQHNSARRRNRGVLVVGPVFQTGYRSIHLPTSFSSFLKMIEWPSPQPPLVPLLPLVKPLADVLMLVHLDTSAMLETQFDPNFFGPPVAAAPQPNVKEIVEAAEVLSSMGAQAPQSEGRAANGQAQTESSAGVVTTENGLARRLRVVGMTDISGLPDDCASIRAASAASRLTSFYDMDDGVGVLGPGLGSRSLVAWQLLYAINAHLQMSIYHTHPQQKAVCARNMASAEAYIMTHHIFQSLTRLLPSLSQPGGHALQPWERRSAMNMAMWLGSRVDWAEQNTRLAGEERRWQKLADRTASVCMPVEGEVCFVCNAAVSWDDNDVSQARCSSGHLLSRCMETLLVIETIDLWECRCCLRKARSHNVPGPIVANSDMDDDEEEEEDDPLCKRPPWLPDQGGLGAIGGICLGRSCRLFLIDTPARQRRYLKSAGNKGSTSTTASLELRPYQDGLLREAKARVDEGSNRLLFTVATGLGKTAIFANLPSIFPRHQKYGTLVLVHRDELIQQASAAFRAWAPDLRIGIEQGSRHTVEDPVKVDVVIASVQTLGRSGPSSVARLGRYKGWGGIVVVDEAHHLRVDSTYDTILKTLGLGGRRKQPQQQASDSEGANEKTKKTKEQAVTLRKLLLGFTATPFRQDRASLGDFFDLALTDHNLAWGIRHGWLVDIVVHRVRTLVDLDHVPQRMGDLVLRSLDKAVNVEDRNLAAVKAIKEHGGKQAIVFCASVAHAMALAAKLESSGIRAEAVHGDMVREERQAVLQHFRTGSISVLTNFNVLTEGFDAPACDTIVMCRPTISPGLYLQMIGRGTRPVAAHTGSSNESNIPERLQAIEQSSKPRMRLIDLVDNCTKHRVVTLPVLLGLRSDFDLKGTVGEVVTELEDALHGSGDDDDEALAKLLSDARSVEDLRLKVEQFRLMDGRRGGSSPLPDRVCALLPAGDPRPCPNDRFGLTPPSRRIKGGTETTTAPRVFAVQLVKVTRVVEVDWKVEVQMKDAAGTVYVWATGSVRDTDEEEVYAGMHYLLMAGTIKAVGTQGQNMKVELTRAVLQPVYDERHNIKSKEGDDPRESLMVASRQVLNGAMPVEEWMEVVARYLLKTGSKNRRKVQKEVLKLQNKPREDTAPYSLVSRRRPPSV